MTYIWLLLTIVSQNQGSERGFGTTNMRKDTPGLVLEVQMNVHKLLAKFDKNVIFSVWCLRGLLGSCLYSWPKIKLNVSLSLWCYCSTSNHFTVVLSFISSVDSTPSISIVNPIVADNSGARLMTNCWQESWAVQGGVQDNISEDESSQFFHWPHSITISLSVDDEKVTCKRGKNKITLTTDWSQENTQQPKNQTYSIVWEQLTSSVALQ